MGQRTILIVAPHPDDETLGCGGVLAQRVQEGLRVAIVVLTDGCNLFRLSRWHIETDPTPKEVSARRKEETRRAVDILGGEGLAIRFLDVEDASLARHVEPVSEQLAEIIREVSPEEIYVTSEYEEHPDHVAGCAAARAAMRMADCTARLFRYVIALRAGLTMASIPEPKVSVDISSQMERKRQAVSQFVCHLKVVAKGQTEPLFRGVDDWVRPREVFFVEAESRPR